MDVLVTESLRSGWNKQLYAYSCGVDPCSILAYLISLHFSFPFHWALSPQEDGVFLWRALHLPQQCLWPLFPGCSSTVSLAWLPSKAWSATSPIAFCSRLFQMSLVAIHLILGLNLGWNLTQHKQGRFAESYINTRGSDLPQAVLWHRGCLCPRCQAHCRVTTDSGVSTHSLLVESDASLC